MGGGLGRMPLPSHSSRSNSACSPKKIDNLEISRVMVGSWAKTTGPGCGVRGWHRRQGLGPQAPGFRVEGDRRVKGRQAREGGGGSETEHRSPGPGGCANTFIYVISNPHSKPESSYTPKFTDKETKIHQGDMTRSVPQAART